VNTDPNQLLKDIGRRIAELRSERGLTQEQLAERLDVTPRHIQSVEGGFENPTVRTLVTFSDALGVEVVELFNPPKSRVVRQGRPPQRG